MNEFQFEKIVELREKNGLSQRELGKYIGVSDRAVSKWEIGLSSPTAKNMIQMSQIFNVPAEYFFETKRETENEVSCSGMESVTELYKIGRGPSSSHTIGPERACLIYKKKHPDAEGYKVILYGSLAKTGKGHGTDNVIRKTFFPQKCDIEFNFLEKNIPHPNTFDIISYKKGEETGIERVFSVGGGSIVFEADNKNKVEAIYKQTKFSDIALYCRERSKRLWEYVIENEGEDVLLYMQKIWEAMKESINRGLECDGILPGGLEVQKKAKALFESQHIDETSETRANRVVCAYAFAVSEQNASGEKIVTAPTCGAAGVIPAVLYYHQQKNSFSDMEIIHALMTAGLIGNLIKTNASISGAECGCQAEVGSACAMAAAALAELFELSIDKIEYAAEIAIEHHLGLTCDPICGLVQIPCIERNAVAAMRAINAVNLASFLWNTRKISLDRVIQTMKETGRDMHTAYKETSEGGLAKIRID